MVRAKEDWRGLATQTLMAGCMGYLATGVTTTDRRVA